MSFMNDYFRTSNLNTLLYIATNIFLVVFTINTNVKRPQLLLVVSFIFLL